MSQPSSEGAESWISVQSSGGLSWLVPEGGLEELEAMEEDDANKILAANKIQRSWRAAKQTASDEPAWLTSAALSLDSPVREKTDPPASTPRVNLTFGAAFNKLTAAPRAKLTAGATQRQQVGSLFFLSLVAFLIASYHGNTSPAKPTVNRVSTVVADVPLSCTTHLSPLQDALARSDEALARSDAELSDARNELNSALEARAHAEKYASEQSTLVEKLRGELAAAREETAAKRADAAAAKRDARQARGELATARSALLASKRASEADVEARRKERDGWRWRLEEQERQMASLHAEADDAKSTAKEARRAEREGWRWRLNQDLQQEQQDTIDAQAQEIAQLQGSATRLTEERDALKREVRKLRAMRGRTRPHGAAAPWDTEWLRDYGAAAREYLHPHLFKSYPWSCWGA